MTSGIFIKACLLTTRRKMSVEKYSPLSQAETKMPSRNVLDAPGR